MKRIIFTLLATMLLTAAAGAQSIQISPKFGNVSDAELDMTVYPKDTSAAVVILYRHVEVSASFSATFGLSKKVTFTERVKILKESGKDYPDYKISYRTSCDPRESVTGIKVWTHNRQDGKKVVDKLPRKMIFDEEVTDRLRRVSFSAQNVRVGSVVEVTFTTESPYVADIGTVYLQTYYPVNWSEATVSYAQCFNFNRITRGAVPCTTTTESENQTMLFAGGASLPYEQITDHHVAYDVPAMKREPHCYCPDLYRLGFDYDLRFFRFEDLYYKEYSTTWQEIDKTLSQDGYLKDYYAKSAFSAEAEQILASTEDEAERISRIRDAVAQKVNWNKKSSISPHAARALKEQSGNSADINALVAAALNGAGFTADPVLLCTRDNGILMDYHVSIDAYNDVLLRVTAPSGNVYYLDAVWPYGYINVLKPEKLVSQARVIPKNGKGEWADLRKLARNQVIEKVTMDVSPDGSVSGTNSEYGYNEMAATMKVAYKSFDEEEKLISRLESETGIEVDDFKFEGADSWSSAAQSEYKWSKAGTASGDLIYVKPFLSPIHSASDFKDPERKLPVEFPFAHSFNYSATITIPEGYTVESLPQSCMIPCKSAGSRAVTQFLYDGERTVSVNYRFTLDEMLVPATQYDEIRGYWESLANLYNSTVVLKKK